MKTPPKVDIYPGLGAAAWKPLNMIPLIWIFLLLDPENLMASPLMTEKVMRCFSGSRVSLVWI